MSEFKLTPCVDCHEVPILTENEFFNYRWRVDCSCSMVRGRTKTESVRKWNIWMQELSNRLERENDRKRNVTGDRNDESRVL